MRVLVIFLLFHFLIDKILSKQGCPETPIELSEQEAHLVDITIMLANKENYLFSSPLLDKMKNSFMICKPNPNNIDLINHTLPKRYLVNYKAAEVYARPYQLFLFYPLTNMINGRCPFSRYLTVNLKCPRKMNFQRKPISVGKDMCDLTFVIYEPQACFINFTIDFDHQMYKNFSFEDVKLSNVIVILFLLSAL
ncbi:hypothetical protein HZS_3753 [Henneguya salminicola]|nr:hypothetical protein HZS_3753 [Henneguya salminicola]